VNVTTAKRRDLSSVDGISIDQPMCPHRYYLIVYIWRRISGIDIAIDVLRADGSNLVIIGAPGRMNVAPFDGLPTIRFLGLPIRRKLP